MDYNLLDLADVVRSWGRGVVFYAPRWDPGLGDAFNMTHLGDTEGDISIATNAALASLTVPELTGPAAHEVDFTGENPVIEFPLYLTDPALLAVVSPSGSAHGGRSRRYAPIERTIVIMPEALFLVQDPITGFIDRKTLARAAGAWTLDGDPLDAARTTLLGTSFWLWRSTFNRPNRRFLGGAGDARKNIETVTVQSMHHPDMPEGHHLYTTGDPAEAGIDLEGGS